MILAETHIVDKSKELDELTFKCKNLYNKANYEIRQEFILNRKYLSKFDMHIIAKKWDEYKLMPARVSRGVLRTLDSAWLSFFSCIKKWKTNKELFLGRPNLPKYLPKQGRFFALFFDNAILKPNKNKIGIGLSSLNLRIQPKAIGKIIEVQVIPTKTNKYRIHIIYDYNEEKLKSNNDLYCSIDMGVNNFLAITSNKIGFQPTVVKGGPLKSMNQFYNKSKAEMQSQLPNGVKSSRRIDKLSFKHSLKINDLMHKASACIIKLCVNEKLNTIVIGYNEFWKQKINIGSKNNQNFVQIPFEKFVRMVEYKSKKYGLNFILNEESYTSKCSFLDLEKIERHENYSGNRISRGMFKSANGNKLNADVNGSYNILRKAIPNAFSNGIEGVAIHPKVMKVL